MRRRFPLFILSTIAVVLGGMAIVWVRPAAAASFAPDTAWTGRSEMVCGAANVQNAPAAVADGAGGVFLVWEDSRSDPDSSDLFAQHLLGDGKPAPGWPDGGLALCLAPGHQSSPQVVLDGAGGIIAAWEDDRGTGVLRVYAQHLTSGLVFASGWNAFGQPLCSAPGVEHAPQLASDDAGGAIAVWEDYRSGPPRVMAQRIQPGGTLAPGWPDTALLVSPVFAGQVDPQIVADGSGGALIGWSDARGGILTGADIYAQHLLGTGARAGGWPTTGLAVCAAFGTQERLKMCADGSGGACFTWMDPRDGSSTIYAQHVTAGGTLPAGWPADGISAGFGPGNMFDPVVASDGLGTVLVAWTDTRAGALNADIYGQRFAADATPSWDPDGLVLCAATGSQISPAILPDGAGGALVTWMDPRFDGSPRLFAQRIPATGVIPSDWPVDGLAIADTNLIVDPLAMVTDGNGGAIVAWSGINLAGGGDPPDIFAARFTGNGVVPAEASLLAADSGPDGVTLRWWVVRTSVVVHIERREGEGAWQEAATLASDGSGVVTWLDPSVVPGRTYGWRLRIDGASSTAGEVQLTIPELALAITRVGPQPSSGSATVSLSLARLEPARLALFDLAGRRRWERELPGAELTSRLTLDTGTLEPGVYLLRLVQGDLRAGARLVVAR